MADLPQSRALTRTSPSSPAAVVTLSPSNPHTSTPSAPASTFPPATPPSSKPPLISIFAYHAHARRTLPPPTFAYYDSGAGDEQSLRSNSASLSSSLLIRPRHLIDVSSISLSTSYLGLSLPSPLALAPSAMQRMAHADGELASARAAASRGVPLTLSTMSHTSLEDIATAIHTTPISPPSPSYALPPPLFYQLYAYNDLSLTSSLISRASTSHYHALFLTIDTPAIGLRPREVAAGFVGSPAHLPLANFREEGLRGLSAFPVGKVDDGVDAWGRSAKVTWDMLKEWRTGDGGGIMGGMKVVVKGVMTAEDAVLACEAGCDGLVVSNHGGRQLDGVPATIEVLSEVVRAVRGWRMGRKGMRRGGRRGEGETEWRC